MDMWEPYVQATRDNLPGAATKIVFDRFHIMKHMSKAVDRVRRREHRDKLLAHLCLAIAGSVLITIGTAVHSPAALAAIATVPVTFVV